MGNNKGINLSQTVIILMITIIFCIPISEQNIVTESNITNEMPTISSLKKGTNNEIQNAKEKYNGKCDSPNLKNPDKHNTNGKTAYQTHLLTREEVEIMKKTIGVRDMNKNYNTIIDGRGTGLAPPTEEEWEWMIGRIEVVDEVPGHKSPIVTKDFGDSVLKDRIEDAPSVNDALPTREGGEAISDIRSSGLSVEPTSRGIGVGLPTSVDHSTSNFFPAVGDQGGQGSCAAWATTYYAQGFAQAKDNEWNQAHLGNTAQLMSPAWTYNKVNGGEDEGSFSWTNAIILQQYGCPTLASMPYDDTNYTGWGAEADWREAPSYKISKFQLTDYQNINTVKSCNCLPF